jgi:3-dehydroquinate synthase
VPGEPASHSRITIGKGFLAELPALIEPYLNGRSPFWIWDQKVLLGWRQQLLDWGWPDPLQDAKVIPFVASEAEKRLAAIEQLASTLILRGADRGAMLIAVGGGVTGDVAGFLSSIYMRGIPCLQVPTTLLAQVDSSVGGKTGVDLELGKNLLGTFHQPRAVWIDMQFLESLPVEEFRQGMAEVIKTAMIGDARLWEHLELNREAIGGRDPEALLQMVSACVRLKAEVVRQDARESGLRRVLNLGHTVGHALEKVSAYTVRHGDAVAIGMVAAAKLSLLRGKLQEGVLERLRALCGDWELPVGIPAEFRIEDILSSLQADKKIFGGILHFILPVSIGRVDEEDDLSMVELAEVLASMQCK